MNTYYRISNGGNCYEVRECSASASDYAPFCECPACVASRERKPCRVCDFVRRIAGVVKECRCDSISHETRV